MLDTPALFPQQSKKMLFIDLCSKWCWYGLICEIENILYQFVTCKLHTASKDVKKLNSNAPPEPKT